MSGLFDIPINAVKSTDKLLQHLKEETVDEVEELLLNH